MKEAQKHFYSIKYNTGNKKEQRKLSLITLKIYI